MKSRRLFTVLMIFAIAAPMAIADVNAMKLGYSGIGTSNGTASPFILYNNASVTIPSGYIGLITKAWIYSNATAHLGLYSETYDLLLDSGDVTVSAGLGWYSKDCSLLIETGIYHVACGYVSTGAYYFNSGVSNLYSNYTVGYSFSDPAVIQADWTGSQFSGYFEFELIETANNDILTGVYTFGYVAIIAILLVVFFKGTPLLMMVFGSLGITISAGLWSSEYVIFTPFLQTASVIVSFLLLVYSYVIWKGN